MKLEKAERYENRNQAVGIRVQQMKLIQIGALNCRCGEQAVGLVANVVVCRSCMDIEGQKRQVRHMHRRAHGFGGNDAA